MRMADRLFIVGCALVLLVGCGGGGGDTGTDTTSLSDVPGLDQGPNDLNCIPQCKDKTCGENGCGGSCGECSGETPYCYEGVCVPECATEKPVVEGWVKNNVSDMDFTGEPVDVQLFHKLDIDKVEDGCISKYVIAMSKVGLGCHFSIQLETDSVGHFGVTETVLKADSFCPGWLDSDEGDYRLHESSLVVCSNVEVTDYMVESTCIPNVSLGFSGLLTLKRIGDGKVLDVDLSELHVVGDMTSTGFTELTCPDLCAGKECGDNGCGGDCGTCSASSCLGLVWALPKTCMVGTCMGETQNCDDGKVCTTDTCDDVAGCVHANNTFPCATSKCEAGKHFPATNCSGGTCPSQTGITCDDGKACTSDTCNAAIGCGNIILAGYCLINGTCYTDGQTNPSNVCKVCTTTTSSSAWSNVKYGTACGTAGTCQSGQCVGESVGPWTDPETNLTWQNPPAEDTMNWSNAKQYCSGLALDGGGWHLPSIGELRTLIRGCSDTVTGGACGVTDSCLSYSSCWSEGTCQSCSSGEGPTTGCYWPDEMQGNCGWYWSSSAIEDHTGFAFAVNFNSGDVLSGFGGSSNRVRCVQ